MELRNRITQREFVDWLHFLRWEDERQTKADYQLATIAAEVRRGNVKHPNKVKMSDFLVKMKTQDEAEVEDKTAKSKVAWLSAAGLKPKKGSK